MSFIPGVFFLQNVQKMLVLRYFTGVECQGQNLFSKRFEIVSLMLHNLFATWVWWRLDDEYRS